jgi:Tfp pilus assembly protein PilO
METLLNSRKHLYVMAVGLCLAVLVGGWFLLISPKKAQVADLQSQAGAQESTNNGLRSQIQALQVLQAKLPEQQASLARMQSKVPQTAALPELLRVLNKAAIDSGVQLIGVTPTATAALPNAAGVSGIDVAMKATGDYVSLEQYQLALEALPRAFLVNGMTIVTGSGSPTSSTSASTSASADALTATINGRVLLQATPAGGSTGTTPPKTATTSG